MEFHRLGVRVDLDHPDLCPIFAGVLVERDQPGLVRLDEVAEPRDATPLLIELALLEAIGCDEDDRPRHGVSSVARSAAIICPRSARIWALVRTSVGWSLGSET